MLRAVLPCDRSVRVRWYACAQYSVSYLSVVCPIDVISTHCTTHTTGSGAAAARTSTRAIRMGAYPASLESDFLESDTSASPRSDSWIACSIGMAKAPVLPLPVSAAICVPATHDSDQRTAEREGSARLRAEGVCVPTHRRRRESKEWPRPAHPSADYGERTEASGGEAREIERARERRAATRRATRAYSQSISSTA